jgi:hypothetical protein
MSRHVQISHLNVEESKQATSTSGSTANGKRQGGNETETKRKRTKVIRISFLTRSSSKPRSAQLIVTCRMSSSNACEYNSRRTGQIPVSRACRCCRKVSNCSWCTTMENKLSHKHNDGLNSSGRRPFVSVLLLLRRQTTHLCGVDQAVTQHKRTCG